MPNTGEIKSGDNIKKVNPSYTIFIPNISLKISNTIPHDKTIVKNNSGPGKKILIYPIVLSESFFKGYLLSLYGDNNKEVPTLSVY
jgi:hypothetical protein